MVYLFILQYTSLRYTFENCTGLKKITFEGDAPTFNNGYYDTSTFYNVSADVYFPAGNVTWVESKRQQFGGTLNWISYGEGAVYDYAGTCGASDSDDVNWGITADGTLEIYGTGSMETYSEDSAAPWKQYQEYITSASIKEGVTTVGPYAFYGCENLKKIDLSSTVTNIEMYAFKGCTSLQITELPETLKTIRNYAFEGCTGLKEINFKGIKNIGRYIFKDCTSLEKIIIGEGCSSIGSYAFSGCLSLKEVDMPSTLTSIGTYAFSGCSSLKNIEFPATITGIGENAFKNCTGIETLTFTGDAPTTIATTAFTGDTFKAYFPAGNKTWTYDKRVNYGGTITWESYGEGIIYDGIGTCGDNIEWVLVDDVLTISGQGAMNNYSHLSGSTSPWYASRTTIKKCIIESGITSVGKAAFYSCYNMEEIIIPDTVKTLGTYCLRGYSKLESVKFSGSAPESIASDAFYNTTTTAYFPAGDKTWNLDVRQNYGGTITWESYGEGKVYYAEGTCGENLKWEIVDKILRIYGEGVMDSYSSSSIPWYQYREYIESVSVETGVLSISEDAFAFCSNLIEVSLPERITVIPNSVFQGCTSLKSVKIPSTVTQIDSSAFWKCTSLIEITIPGTVEQYGYNIFYGCTGLEKVIFAEGIQEIPYSILDGCTSLKEVVLPSTLKTIKSNAFKNCSSLSSITIPAQTIDINSSAFSGCTAVKEFVIEEGNTKYKAIDGMIYSLNGKSLYAVPGASINVIIHEGTTLIDGNAFVGCAGLEYIMVLNPSCELGSNCIPDIENLIVYGYAGSTAENYVKSSTNIKFVALTQETCIHPEKYEVKIDEVKPTCTESGLTEGKECSICEKILVAQEEVAAKDHSWDDDYTVDKEASCTKEGSKSIHCVNCTATKDITEIPKKEHSYGDWVIDKESNCTEAGSKHKECTVCGDPVTETIPVKDHSWDDDYTVDKEASCTKEGSKSIHCVNCTATKDATEIPKKEHSYGDWVIDKEANCTEAGSKHKECTVCGDPITETIPAKDHSWDDDYTVDKEASCTKEGSKSIHCENCSEVKDVTIIKKLDHNWLEWTVIIKPTSQSEGLKERRCSACKGTEQDIIEKTLPVVNPFDDVSADEWYYNAVLWAVNEKITSGTSETTFSPDNVCTRAQVVTFLWNQAKQPVLADDTMAFEDVAKSEWYYNAVRWAVSEKITSGTSETTFSPNNVCTR